MKIVVDVSALTAGGGQKVGWNFVHSVISAPICEHEIFFICAEGSLIHKLLTNCDIKTYCAIPSSALKRIRWQIFFAPEILKKIAPDIIYHVFGAPLYPRCYIQVIGEACSNLFYPEIKFWEGIPWYRKFLKYLKDQFRIAMFKRADGVIFENDSMRKRAIDLFHLSPDRVCYIKPSILKVESRLPIRIPAAPYSILMLCSWQRNKNFMIMPSVLSIIKKHDFPVVFNFSVSAHDSCPEARTFYGEAERLGVSQMINYLGVIPPEKIPEVYAKADVILLLSKLESFSNNIIEAWKYRVPLLISDMEWSHSLAQDGACFVDRNNPEEIASCIEKIMIDSKLRNRLIECGGKELANYPDSSEHTKEVFGFLDHIHTYFGDTKRIKRR